MVPQLSHLKLLLLLASFVALVKGQDDQFDFPNTKGGIPQYHNRDTLLVKYTTRIHGPGISLALKCVLMYPSDFENNVLPEVNTDALTGMCIFILKCLLGVRSLTLERCIISRIDSRRT